MDGEDFGINSVSLASSGVFQSALSQQMFMANSAQGVARADLARLPSRLDAPAQRFAEISADGGVQVNGGTPHEQVANKFKEIDSYVKQSPDVAAMTAKVEASAKQFGVSVKHLIEHVRNPGKGNPVAAMVETHMLNMALSGTATAVQAGVKGINKLSNTAQ
jgi:hypothetical protein